MRQIVLAWSPACETELKAMGFIKQEVYVKEAPGTTDTESKKLGEQQLFRMQDKPYQFCVTSCWGACIE